MVPDPRWGSGSLLLTNKIFFGQRERERETPRDEKKKVKKKKEKDLKKKKKEHINER